MKLLNNDEIKKKQLEILQTVHEFCVQNGIRYSMCGGTLIGAVLHKGYIPWDDDIDIMMPRPDYENFCRSFNAFEKKRKVLNSFNSRNFFQPFSKVIDTTTILQETYDRPVPELGINIDVFPIDGLPNNENKRTKYWRKIAKKKNFATVIYQKNNPKEHGIKKIVRFCLFYFMRPFPANFFAKRLHKIGMKNTFETSSVIANSIFGYGRKEEMPGNLFDSFVDMDFEGRRYKAVAQWDTYLRNIFGDYMTLPPKNERIAKHDFEAFVKDE